MLFCFLFPRSYIKAKELAAQVMGGAIEWLTVGQILEGQLADGAEDEIGILAVHVPKPLVLESGKREKESKKIKREREREKKKTRKERKSGKIEKKKENGTCVRMADMAGIDSLFLSLSLSLSASPSVTRFSDSLSPTHTLNAHVLLLSFLLLFLPSLLFPLFPHAFLPLRAHRHLQRRRVHLGPRDAGALLHTRPHTLAVG